MIDFPNSWIYRIYAQNNLVILSLEDAGDFEEYTKKNPFPCPALEVVRGPRKPTLWVRGNLVSDILRYWGYANDVFTTNALTPRLISRKAM